MIVIHITSTAKQGGGPSHILSLLQLLGNKDFEQYAIFPYHQMLSNTLSLHAKKSYEYPKSLKDVFNLISEIRYLSITNDQVLVHSHGPAAALLAKTLKLFIDIKHFYTPHGVQFVNYNFIKKKLYKLYEGVSIRLIDKVVYISPSEQKIFTSNIKSAKLIASDLIENNVNPTKIAYSSLEEFINSISEKICTRSSTVAMIGRITHQKNSLIIFELAKLMPHVQFIYIGDNGELKLDFLNNLNSFKLSNLTYMPNIDDLKLFYSNIDLLIAPSIHEGLPYVVLEALCNYIPVVLSPIPPFIDLFNIFQSPLLNFPYISSSGAISISDYVKCIESVLGTSRVAAAMDEKSKQLVCHYSNSKRWASMYNNTYCS